MHHVIKKFKSLRGQNQTLSDLAERPGKVYLHSTFVFLSIVPITAHAAFDKVSTEFLA